jgi:hypothetical protein
MRAKYGSILNKEMDKDYCQRHVFFLAGNQDILAENLKFTYIEINDRLA